MILIHIVSTYTNKEVLQICYRCVPSLNWRMGDSDMGGPYVSGSLPGVRIQCWTGEEPMSLGLSFSEHVSVEDRDKWAAIAREVLAPQIGMIVKASAR